MRQIIYGGLLEIEINEKMLFHELAKTLQQISDTKDTETKKQIFSNSWQKYLSTKQPSYCFMSLLFPSMNKSRKFGLKESSLVGIYLKVIGISENSLDAQPLLAWSHGGGVGGGFDKTDFSTVLTSILEQRSTVSESSLTLEEANAILDKLHDIEAGKYVVVDWKSV